MHTQAQPRRARTHTRTARAVRRPAHPSREQNKATPRAHAPAHRATPAQAPSRTRPDQGIVFINL
ncbi:hypothetical protein HYPSUDRAFT_43288 [Hypholoma sublateritium FD-334 SS-4]|uniref:Uncharacterized protein n=1 Tax=Hypholoma sublateritium (strain FD-334 SS-4) TaxID=945553 RepID=A0A0D2PK98_HYPSF|nr:hypothetical protein HYPSUDRAFT_43288 [Hypholoma sublateritium FD-334 SS-4]